MSSRQQALEDHQSIPNKSQESLGSTLNQQLSSASQGASSAVAAEVTEPKLVPIPSNPNPSPKAAPITTKASAAASKPLAVKTRDIYESGFSYSNPALCPNDGVDIQLFIMIMSAPGHVSAREAIRLTWGHFSQRMDISIAFLIGKWYFIYFIVRVGLRDFYI